MAGSELSILLIEDNPADVYLFKAALHEKQIVHRLEVVKNGTDAWSRLTKCLDGGARPQVVVLDLNLPGMNGRQVLAHLAEECPELHDLPICVFTGASTEETVVSEFPRLRLSFERKTDSFSELQDIVCRIAGLAFAN